MARRSLCGAFSAQMLEYSRVTARQFTHIWKERQRCPGVCSCSYHRNRAAIFLGVGVAACLQAAMFNSAAGLAVPCGGQPDPACRSRTLFLPVAAVIYSAESALDCGGAVILDVCGTWWQNRTAVIVACDQSHHKMVLVQTL